MPRGPVTESEAGAFAKETDGWNRIGAFPMLDVCFCVTVEEEKERRARGTLRAEVCGIMVGGLGSDSESVSAEPTDWLITRSSWILWQWPWQWQWHSQTSAVLELS